MSLSTPTKLTNLRSLLANKPQQEVLRLYLHQNQDNLLKEAVLVTIFRKWSVLPPYTLTEIGVTTYERQQVHGGRPCPPGPHAEDLLRHVWSMHYRIRENAHVSATKEDPTEADQTPFHFGYSVFVTLEDAMDVLQQIWHQPIDMMKLEKGHRPVICLSYGNNDVLGKTRHVDFDFSPTKIGTTVAMLDAQNIAIQAKITSSGDASIDYLLPIFQIRPYDEHNAGNAAMYVTVLAFLSVLRKELYGSEANPKARPGQQGISSTKTARSVMQWLMDHPTPVPPFGVTTYCSRCSSFVHTVAECPNTDFVCSKCLASKIKFRQENAVTHMEGLCIYR
ncbi:hypothetical protein HBI56_055330 [Parastagonospora nodorum]|nr:hypothetical protein HBI10_068310 [Parastagonospora nodorum]KAH4028067.1 hypothetical protein HBI13_049710 [Parastagonospora nodorum]KAH4070127.1 hypothetical protein HBH50_094380 [Parastagonospora nodorum]KAH4090692.1 hypothetical protein HBH48_098150 [Parastagonospora nodorum]KAH4401381.1 hypothetical protein HBH92_225380 [Parastagonospora nodorum]